MCTAILAMAVQCDNLALSECTALGPLTAAISGTSQASDKTLYHTVTCTSKNIVIRSSLLTC